MRYLIIVLVLSGTFQLSGQETLLFEDFQSQTLGVFTTLDNDNLTMDASFTGLNGAFNIIPVNGPADFRAVGVSLFAVAGEADNWLISPQIQLNTSGASLKWKAASLSGEAERLDSYRVMISTASNAIEDFEVLETYIDQEFEVSELELSLSAYEGQAIYIAFNQFGSDNYALALDDIAVVAPSATNALKLVAFQGDRYQDLSSFEVALEVLNTGSETINSFVASGSINGNIGDFLFDNLSILPGETAFIQFAELFPFTAAKHVIMATVTNINGQAFTADTISDNFFIIQDPPLKKFVYEEATSTSCGWCIAGLVQKDLMAFKYPNDVINISVHSDDPMQNIFYALGMQNQEGFLGFPSAVLNRQIHRNHEEVEAYYLNDFSTVAPMTLDLDYDYNPEDRALNVSLSSVAHTTLDSEIHRYSLLILEDRIQGNSADFAQANNYSFEAGDLSLLGIDGVEWQTRPDPVPASEMVYNDVIRDFIGGYDGIEGSITSSNQGETLSYALDYVVSSAFDDTQLWLVALAIDSETGQIVNAQEEQLLFESRLKEPVFASSIKLFPNPAVLQTKLEVTANLPQNVKLLITDNLGQILVSKEWYLVQGKNTLDIPVNQLVSGLYQLSLYTDNGLITKQLAVFSE